MEKNEDDGVIQIPIGGLTRKIKANIWKISTIIFALAFLGAIFFNGSSISGSSAGQKVINFVNSQGRGNATFVSSEKVGASLYKVVVNFQGQEIPVHVTSDGQYLVVDPFPLEPQKAAALTGNAVNTPTEGEKVNIAVGDSPMKGNANASVTIVEFSDFECPYCGKYSTETYPQIVKNYIETGKVKYYFKDFPLSFHQNAQKAAEAARCIREQLGDSGFWKMHDKLYANQEELGETSYKKWALELGADPVKFDQCLKSGKYASKVQADLTYGQSVGVSGTPAFFINGQMFTGAQPYQSFVQAIEAELKG